MEQIDLKLKLFCGEPIYVEGYGEIKPLKVKDIVSYGYTEYLKALNIVCLINYEDFIKDKEEVEKIKQELHFLDFLIIFGGEDLENELEKSFSLFLGGEAVVDKDNLCIFINKNNGEVLVVNKENFDNIREVLKYQNYVKHFEEKKIGKDESPMDEETRKFKERLEMLKKKRDEIKRKQQQNDSDENQESDIDFYDIISSISSKSYSINELNVGELTVYQVYSKFKRMEIIDRYDIDIKSILAGAKDIKLRHWSSKID
jgi:hypothetical protein